ncbi:MAG: 2OG-Fe(II) oxygenase [bacterium]
MNILNPSITQSDILKFSEEFKNTRSCLIPAPFDPIFLNKVCSLIDKQEFKYFHDPRIGKEERIDDDQFYAKLNLLLSNTRFLDFIKSITAKNEIKMTTSRVYRIDSKEDHQVYWHNDDRVLSRVLSMRIELSREKYEGGEFQLRDSRSKVVLATSGQLVFGDSFLFEVDFQQLEHQVLQVRKGSRTSIILWFLK